MPLTLEWLISSFLTVGGGVWALGGPMPWAVRTVDAGSRHLEKQLGKHAHTKYRDFRTVKLDKIQLKKKLIFIILVRQF